MWILPKNCKFPSGFVGELTVLNTQVRKKLPPKQLSHHAWRNQLTNEQFTLERQNWKSRHLVFIGHCCEQAGGVGTNNHFGRIHDLLVCSLLTGERNVRPSLTDHKCWWISQVVIVTYSQSKYLSAVLLLSSRSHPFQMKYKHDLLHIKKTLCVFCPPQN